MFIEEMIFSGKHYYRQNELQACLEACKALPVESTTTPHQGLAQPGGRIRKSASVLKQSLPLARRC